MLRENDKIGGYTLIKKVGSGGFGDVWKAEKRTALDVNYFALKFFRPKDDRIDLDKISKEIAVWKKLKGLPHIISVIELDQFEDYVYVVSDYADGGSLEKWLKKNNGKASSEAEAVRITLQILTGLENLHEKGFVHRDLKPDNILIMNGKFCLADFGVSREMKTHSKATGTAGTMEYMPPEAFAKTPSITHQTDIWAVGAILQKLLTGKLPFPQDDQPSLIAAILMSEPDEMSPKISERLREIVKKTLQKKREDRFSSVREMSEALKNPTKFLASIKQLSVNVSTIIDEDFNENLNLAASNEVQRQAQIEQERIKNEKEEKERLGQEKLQKEKEKQERLERERQFREIEAEKELQRKKEEREKLQRESREREALDRERRWSEAEKRRFEQKKEEEERLERERQRQQREKAELKRQQEEEKRQRRYNRELNIGLGVIGGVIGIILLVIWLNSGPPSLVSNIANTSADNARNAAININVANVPANTAVNGGNTVANSASDSKSASDYFNIAYNCYEKQDYDCSIKNYTKAIELKPDNASAYHNRGLAYDKKGNYDQAIQDYTKSIELKPDYANAYYNRGIAYGKKGNYDQAIRDYTKAIELNPDDASSYYNRGIAYNNKGNYDQVIKDYTKAIELKPDYATAYYGRGLAYNNKGNYDQAIKDYTKAIELKPDYATAYVGRGVAYYNKGNYDQEIADYRKALQIDPNHKLAKENLEIVLKRNANQ